MEEGAESTIIPLFEASWGPPVPQHRMRREAGVSDILLGPKEARRPVRSSSCPSGPRATTSQGSARSTVCSPDWSMSRPTWGLSGRVRPMSLGSGNQNWKTAPPLESGHLNESSAPGGTGSPCSIFRKDSRNPENREDERGKDRQDTHRERERGLLKRWRQAQDSTFRLLNLGYGA